MIQSNPSKQHSRSSQAGAPSWLIQLLKDRPVYLEKLNEYTKRLIYDERMYSVWSQLTKKNFDGTDLCRLFDFAYSTLTIVPEIEKAGNPSPDLRSKYTKISKLAGELAKLIGPFEPPISIGKLICKLQNPDGSVEPAELNVEMPRARTWPLFKEDEELSPEIYGQLRKLERAAGNVSEGLRQGGKWDKETKWLAYRGLPHSRKLSPKWAFAAEISRFLKPQFSKGSCDELVAEMVTVIFDLGEKDAVTADDIRKIREQDRCEASDWTSYKTTRR